MFPLLGHFSLGETGEVRGIWQKGIKVMREGANIGVCVWGGGRFLLLLSQVSVTAGGAFCYLVLVGVGSRRPTVLSLLECCVSCYHCLLLCFHVIACPNSVTIVTVLCVMLSLSPCCV